jgi:RNA-binding protein
MGKKKSDVPVINIGKNGLTQNLINEINFQLEKHGMVKVKMLRSFREISNTDRKKLAEEIGKNIKGRMVNLRGMVITFTKS